MTLTRACLLASLLLAASLASAATFRVDDSASLPGQAQTKMRWRTTGPSRSGGDIVDGAATVTLRLDTSRWVNRSARIYMVLPPQPSAPVSVDWTTQGRMLAGSLVSGDRGLVYAGVISQPMLEDTIQVRVHTDGRRLAAAQRLEFHFEIDVE